jgi:hypothetical protein
MAIVSTDIVYRGSVLTGSAGDSTAQATPSQWLGKYVATTVVGTGANALFDDISGAENAANTVDYRCIFILNNHATLALLNPVVYLSAEVAGGAGIALATDNIAASAKASASAQAAQVANETTAPTGVSAFSSPTNAGAGLSLGATLPAGQVKAVWVRRTAASSAALDADGVTLAVSGDTAA